jgi:hypothetical protein
MDPTCLEFKMQLKFQQMNKQIYFYDI